jgi:hypothetical protein
MAITPPLFRPTIDVLKIQTNVAAVNDTGAVGGPRRFHIGEGVDNQAWD